MITNLTPKQKLVVELYKLYARPGRKRPTMVALGHACRCSPAHAHGALKKAGLVVSRGACAAINWDDQPLGLKPDTQIAKTLGVSAETVRLARRARNIAPARPPVINWANQPLGKVPDQELASKLGTSLTAVCSARRARGIPSVRGWGGRRKGGGGQARKLPKQLVDKWVQLFEEDRLPVAAIKERYPGWSHEFISKTIRRELGVERLPRRLPR